MICIIIHNTDGFQSVTLVMFQQLLEHEVLGTLGLKTLL